MKRKLIALYLVADLVVAGVFGGFELNKIKQTQKAQAEAQDVVQTIGDINKLDEQALKRFEDENGNRKIADYFKEMLLIPMYVQNGNEETKAPYIQNMLARLDWEFASNSNLQLLNPTERKQVGEIIAKWKQRDWSTIKADREVMQTILNKYLHN